jgi:hypothetical protein
MHPRHRLIAPAARATPWLRPRPCTHNLIKHKAKVEEIQKNIEKMLKEAE